MCKCIHCGQDRSEHLGDQMFCPGTTTFEQDAHDAALEEAHRLDDAQNPEADPRTE